MRKPSSVRFSKVKGHATEKQVNEGKVSRKDKHGNDMSDDAAGKGSKLQESLLLLATVYKERERRYASLAERIHNVIIAVMKVAKVQVDEDKKAERMLLGGQAAQNPKV